MSRDPRYLAECRSLVEAVRPFSSLKEMLASPRWVELCPRFEALLRVVRRWSPPVEPAPARAADRVAIVQWNIEHGNWYGQVETALSAHPELAGADVIALEEVDLGCARAGNRDVAFDLAAALGMHAAWAPLFLETTLGRDDDVRMAAGRGNEEGLFGIALLSRWPLGEARLIELPSPRTMQFDVERMVGRHAALAVEVRHPSRPFVAIAAHLEVHRTRGHRAAQVRVIASAMAREKRPVMLAGDFNTHSFDRGLWHTPLQGAVALLVMPGGALRERLRRPDRGHAHEPLFDVLREAGFEWEPFADFAPTLHLREERLEELHLLPAPVRVPARSLLNWAVHRGALRLDWICGRGWSGGSGHTVHGLDGHGLASDHAPIVAELRCQP